MRTLGARVKSIEARNDPWNDGKTGGGAALFRHLVSRKGRIRRADGRRGQKRQNVLGSRKICRRYTASTEARPTRAGAKIPGLVRAIADGSVVQRERQVSSNDCGSVRRETECAN